MIASLRQPPSIDPGPRARGAAKTLEQRVAARALPALVTLFGFFAFLPYVSVNVGRTSALQAGNVLTLVLCVPVLLIPWRRRPFWMVPALLAPLCISTFLMALRGGDVDLAFKNTAVWAMSALALMATQAVAPGFTLALLSGIAAAAILHVLVGFWQLVAFQSGYLPLVGLYQNQSFLSVQDYAETIARYIQRPFGLFPEPSAMSASLAPFVLLWCAVLGGLVRLRQAPSRAHKVLFAVAAAGSLGLMIISRSGHTAITLAAGLVLAIAWVRRSRATPGNVTAIILALGVALPAILYFAADALDDRMGGGEMGNSSWAERSSSLVIGLQLLGRGGPATALFGLGAGMMSPLMQKLYGLEAVWSITLTYLYETGALGVLIAALVARHLLRAWRGSGFDPVFAAILFTWLVGVTITTSYGQLLPVWMALGWLTVWGEVCLPGGKPEPALAAAISETDRVPSAERRWSASRDANGHADTRQSPASGWRTR